MLRSYEDKWGSKFIELKALELEVNWGQSRKIYLDVFLEVIRGQNQTILLQ